MNPGCGEQGYSNLIFKSSTRFNQGRRSCLDDVSRPRTVLQCMCLSLIAEKLFARHMNMPIIAQDGLDRID